MVRRMLTGVHFDKKRGVQATPIAIVNQMIDANLEFAIQQRGYASKTRKSLTLAIWDTSVSPSTVKMAGAVWKIAMDNIKQAHARGNSGIVNDNEKLQFKRKMLGEVSDAARLLIAITPPPNEGPP
ncbi:hypothetical protein CABS01_06778 [Colletotrichum abscissum]|uniref:uncharacterized protein n=1 Tax=Colletotrichum abscissum TaxID=1671311 RepID=UPI0027D5C304|nr:uncharacterized protein CABS01_06778 [Colletotrichum abscissum]KAK1514799.1 hypothetical protein CABS01_06778 [Colletotrichum abscissum]